MSFTFKRVGLLLPAVLGLAAGCGGSDLVLPSEGVAAKIVALSGDKQAGVVGATLVGNLVVRVTDSKDRPVQGQQVTFTPADAGSGQAVPPSPTTNADGQVSVQWVLGTVAGTQTMVAKAVGNGAPANLAVIFTATASSSPPAKLEKVAGDGQTATAGSAVATAPAVKVTDANGNPVVGVGVTFVAATGSGSVNPTTPVPTNANGVAAATSWTLGTKAGTDTLTATIPGTGINGNPATFTATGIAGTVGTLAITQQPSATAQSGVAFAQQPRIQLQDALGNAVHTAGIAVTAAVASGAGGVLGGQLTVSTDNQGLASFTNLAITGLPGTYTISFSNPTLTGVTSAQIALAAGPPAQLAITMQPPATAQSGVILVPQPVVQVQDAQGNPVAQAGITVTASLNGTGGSLGGTKTVNTDATGTAAFTNLAINGSSGTYSITFSASPLTSATSNSVTVGAGTATQLVFTQQPSNVAAGAVITPAVTVSIEDGAGNVVTTATNQVTIAIASNPSGGALSGTLTVSPVNGVATFSNLSINKTGVGYTLSASSGGLAGATSTSFSVTAGVASQLVFTQQPSNVTAGSTISPAVQVSIEDGSGNVVTSATGQVTIAIANNPSGGTLSGTATVAAVSGIATFSSLSINKAGTGYTLSASSAGLTGSTSTAFNVTAAAPSQLAFTRQPSNVTAGAAITPSVRVSVEDAFGNVVTTATNQVAVAIASNPAGGTLSGTVSVSAVNGIATFSTLSIDKAGTGYTLSANSTGLSGTTSSSFNVTPATASQLVFTQQPTDVAAGSTITPAVQVSVEDQFGNVTSATTSITIAIGTNPSGGTLSGSLTVAAVNGVATFPDLSIDMAGTGYTLTGNGGGLPQVESSPFNVN